MQVLVLIKSYRHLLLEALEDALAEEIEAKQLESSSDEEEDALPCRVAMLSESIHSESAGLQAESAR